MSVPTATRFRFDSAVSRGVAAVVLLYMLNAFVQSWDWLTLAELVAGAIWVCGCVVICRWVNVWGLIGLSFAASVVWAFIVDSQPMSDFLTFHKQAASLADGDVAALLGSKSPATVAYYGAFHAVFGSSYVTNYLAGALAWSAGALGLYKAVMAWAMDERSARVVCAYVALYPSFVAFAVVPSSEAIMFLLTGLGVWFVALGVRSSGWRRARFAALVGLTIGLMYTARMNSLLLLLPCGVVLATVGLPEFRRGAGRQLLPTIATITALVAAFVIVVTIFGSLCAFKEGQFRIRPSPWSEGLLLMGTNTETLGGYNRADLVLAGYDSQDPDVRARAPAVAREMAFDRVTRDIPRFLSFALTTKTERLWDKERSLSHWSIGDTEQREKVSYPLRGAAIFAGDSAYRIVFLLFLGFLILQVRRPTTAVMLGGVVLLLSLPHIFIEVQPRYHVPMIPFMIVALAILLDRFMTPSGPGHTRLRAHME
ncbi:MAG: hypothetical protein OXU77_18810 [Gammaproteobacteria bacterium]|nr:hypothetical protein [Gammaproteobacteria bacterium]